MKHFTITVDVQQTTRSDYSAADLRRAIVKALEELQTSEESFQVTIQQPQPART